VLPNLNLHIGPINSAMHIFHSKPGWNPPVESVMIDFEYLRTKSLWDGVLGAGEDTGCQASSRTRRDDPATGDHIALCVASSFNCNMLPRLEEG
jgi:hypothetical protein